jgi:hypothetical protein
MSYPQPPYPSHLDTGSLGTLRPLDAEHEHVFVPQQMPLLRGRPVELRVYVVSEGRIEIDRVPAQIDHYWHAIAGSLDELLKRSHAEVADAIDWFWGLDEPPPSAATLIAASRLDSVTIYCDHESGCIELQLFDEGDLIGGHDLTIVFDKDLNAHDAGFDG